jgi:hypothetical protein
MRFPSYRAGTETKGMIYLPSTLYSLQLMRF